jgi:hypothetical protein
MFGQNKMNHWHFGDKAGLDFSSGSPVATTSAIYAYEGVSSISDGCSTLFYTDGDTVFDRNNQPMPNGIGLAGKCSGFGMSSNSQSSIIIPEPSSDSIFYIFTVDCIEDTLIDGLQYSVVNMKLNGGLGDVSLKNIPLHPTVEEKITATRHANGCDYWIVSHEYFSNAFYSYRLTNTGLNPVPVISYTGQTHGQAGSGIFDCSRGSMKFSPDGTKLVSASTDGVFDYCNFLFPEMFNFDKNTGVVSSAYIIDTITEPGYGTVPPSYGVSFSPDNTKLYMSSGFYGWLLYQYDLTAGTPMDVMNSRFKLSSVPDSLFHNQTVSAIQIGPDNKIYLATDSTFISVINNPNVLGLGCNYNRHSTPMLANTFCYSGLPNFPDNFLTMTLSANFLISTGMVNDTSFFTDLSIGGSIWHWDFGDGASSIIQNPKHIYSTPGTYTVILTIFDGCDYDRHCETIVILPIGIQENSPLDNYRIYPNPTTLSATLEFKNPTKQECTLTLYDLHGQLLRTIKNITTDKVEIERQSLASGLYFFQLRTEKQIIATGKLTIE